MEESESKIREDGEEEYEDEEEEFEPPSEEFHEYLAEMTSGDDGTMDGEEDDDELLVDENEEVEEEEEYEEDKDASYGHESECSPVASQGTTTRGLMATPLPGSYRNEAAMMLSPFSPTPAGRTQRHRLVENDSNKAAENERVSEWTLSKCRKVSILVKVGRYDTSSSLCVFPLIHEQQLQLPQREDTSPITQTMQLASERDTKELVLVNPDAFGDLIPAEVTVETARLVAQVSHVASEDWARRYHFDHILWPSLQPATNPTLIALARAIVHDVEPPNPSNSAVFVFGGSRSDRSQTLFHDGLLPLVAQLLLDKHMIVTLSLIETVEDDIHDMINTANNSAQPKIRHTDKRGAIVTDLHEPEITSPHQLHQLLQSKLYKRQKQSHHAKGHIIATLKVHHPESYQTPQDDDPYNILQLVYCASADDFALAADDSKLNNNNKTNQQSAEKQKIRERRAASVRKSLSGLRGVLRGLIVHDHSAAHQPTPNNKRAQIQPPTISYRECTLTKLIQRCLDAPSSRAVVIGAVCPNRDSYHNTLQTLNFAMRLCSRPGDTAKSPFEARKQLTSEQKPDNDNTNTPRALFSSPSPSQNTPSPSQNDSTSQEISKALLAQLASDERALLRSIVSDPRQRLTRLVTPWLSIENNNTNTNTPQTPTTPQQSSSQHPPQSRDRATTPDGKRLYGSVFEKLDSLEKSPSPPPTPSLPQMTEEEKERHNVTTSEQLEQLHALQRELAEIRKMKEQMGYPSANDVPSLIEEEEDDDDDDDDDTNTQQSQQSPLEQDLQEKVSTQQEEEEEEEESQEEELDLHQEQEPEPELHEEIHETHEEMEPTVPARLLDNQRASLLVLTDGLDALSALVRELRGRVEVLRSSLFPQPSIEHLAVTDITNNTNNTNTKHNLSTPSNNHDQVLHQELDELQKRLHDATIAEAEAQTQLQNVTPIQQYTTTEEAEAAKRLRETVGELSAERSAVEDRVQLLEQFIKSEGSPASPKMMALIPEDYGVRCAAEAQFERLAGEVILLQSSVERATLAREELRQTDGLTLARLREEEASHRRSLETALDRERVDAQQIERLQQEGADLRNRLLQCEQDRDREASDRLAAEQIAEDAIIEHETLAGRAEEIESRLHEVEEELAEVMEELNRSKQESKDGEAELSRCLEELEQLKQRLTDMQASHEDILKKEQERLKEIVENKDSAMHQLNMEISQYKANASLTEAQLSSSLKDIEGMRSEMCDIKALHVEEVEKEQKRAEEIIASKDSTISQLESKTSNYKEAISEYETQFAKNEEEIHKLQRDLSDMRIKHDKESWKHFEEAQVREAALKEKNDKISMLQKNIQVSAEQAAETETALTFANKEKGELCDALAESKSARLESEVELDRLKREVKRLNDAQKVDETTIDRMKQMHDALRAQLKQSTEESHLQHEQVVQLLQTELEETKKAKMNEVRSMQKEIDVMAEKIKRSAESLDNANKLVSSMEPELDELRSTKIQSNDELSRLRSEIDNLRNGYERDNAKAEQVKAAYDLLQAESEKINAAFSKMSSDAKVKDEEIETLRRELDMLKENQKCYSDTADKARDALRAELAELKTYKARCDDKIERLITEIDRHEEARSKDQISIDDMKKINNLLQSQFEHATQNSNAHLEEVSHSLQASISDAKAKDQEIINLRRELGEMREELQNSKSLAVSVTEMNKSLKDEMKQNEQERLNSLWENHEDAIKRFKEARVLDSKKQAELHRKEQSEILALKHDLDALTSDKKKLENDNTKLKSVVQQCHRSMEQMQKEFYDLKSLSNDATARLNDTETLVNKKLEKEMSKMNAMKSEMEKQLVGANLTINTLQQELEIAESKISKASLDGDTATKEKAAEVMTKKVEIDFSHQDVPSLLRMERELRRKAEEIAAALAARAKSGFAQRDEEIVQLRMRLSSLTGGKEMGVRNSLSAGLDHLEDVHDLSVSDMKRERDEARNEALGYKALAEDLHRELYEREHTPAKDITTKTVITGKSSAKPSMTDGH